MVAFVQWTVEGLKMDIQKRKKYKVSTEPIPPDSLLLICKAPRRLMVNGGANDIISGPNRPPPLSSSAVKGGG